MMSKYRTIPTMYQNGAVRLSCVGSKAVALGIAIIDVGVSIIYYYGLPFFVSILILAACKFLLLVYIIDNVVDLLYQENGSDRIYYTGFTFPFLVRSIVGAVCAGVCHTLVWLWRTNYYPEELYWDTRTILFFTTIAMGYAASFTFFLTALTIYFYF